ncbi:DUF6531 domain-containing protein [Streptacidiphilus cavernicola]|uniref:DUF6531 domain-containing protein n=1 Tax=Streptacidiphilus cavernicola TaxID=3342716 RepID=A0ABV6VS14_9ACTN
MTNRIVQALEDGARKLGKTLGEDAGKAVKDFYHSTGNNLKKVAENTAEADAKHAGELKKLMEDGKHDEPHVPHEGGGGEPRPGREPSGGDGHQGPGTGREQVADPREAGRDDDAVCDGGEPVDMATGRMFIDQTDVSLPGTLPLLFTRCFESGYRAGRWMGQRWVCSFDERLEVDPEGVVHLRADRVSQAYPHPEPGQPPVQASAGRRLDLSVDAHERYYTLTEASTGLEREFTVRPGGATALLTRLRNRSGDSIDFRYDADGTPREIVHSGGYRLLVDTEEGRITALLLAGAADDGGDLALLRYGYTDGQLSEVYNSSGLPMRFANDQQGRVVSWTDRNGSHYTYSYDHLGRVVDEGGADGSLRFRFHYGDPDPATGLKVHSETNALGHTTRYEVNAHAQITAQTDPLGNTTRYERDDYDRLLSVTDPLGRTTRYTYDGAGDLVAVTRPDGEQSTAVYEGESSLPSTVTEAGGAVWQQTYDAAGHRTSVTDPLGATTRYAYDPAGHLVSVTDALGGATRIRRNAAGLPTEVTDQTGATTRYERDAFGRAVAVTDATGAVTRLGWTVEGYPAVRTAPDGSVERWTYDGEGNLLGHTDALGRTTCYEYTHFETLAARTGPDGARISFTHDAQMQLTAVTDALGRSWEYHYDAAGRVVGESDFQQRTVGYQYDAAGQITSVTNPLGQVTRFSHDDLGLTVGKDADGRVTRYAYDRAGHLVRATDPDTDLVRTVDALGNLLTETSNGRTLANSYDPLGRRTRRSTPGGHISAWSYDAAGLPLALHTPGGSLDFAYDALGRELRRGIGDTLTLTSSWDSRHRLTGQTLSGRSVSGPEGSPAPLQQRDYRYRADGNLVGVDDRLTGRRDFDLDPVGRVTAVHAEGWTERYAYDPAGNLTEADWPATGATRPALGDRTYTGSRLAAAGRVRYGYDGAGRTVLRQVTRLSRKPDNWHYRYDAEDRLTEVTTPDGAVWRYLYDPLGRRTAKLRLSEDGGSVVERTDFSWDGSTLAEQTTLAPYLPGPHTLSWDHEGLSPLAQTETITVPGGSDDTAQEQVDRRFFAIVTDLVGTPTELVDPETAAIAWRATPTLWGNTTWPSDSSTYTPLRFPGQYFDPETRLHYNVYRYYDPETARYTTPDPLGLVPAPNPDTYVHNPHTWSDPLGLSPHQKVTELPETTAPKPLKPQDADQAMTDFLGPGPYTNIHPRTGVPDPNRLVSADGRRSIRIGNHEMNSKPTKFHFHMETWDFVSPSNEWIVGNTMVRVPLGLKSASKSPPGP